MVWARERTVNLLVFVIKKACVLLEVENEYTLYLLWARKWMFKYLGQFNALNDLV
jgi:hypothetical protein